MANVYSILYTNSNWWDGTNSWGGEVDEATRDSVYSTRTYSSLQAWETARDGAANANDVEYLVIVGPFAAVDTSGFSGKGWPDIDIVIQCPITLNDSQANPARHDGIYGNVANSYIASGTTNQFILVSDGDIQSFTLDGIQVLLTYSTDLYHCCIELGSVEAAHTQTIKNTIVQGVITSTVKTRGVLVTSGNVVPILENLIVYGFPRANYWGDGDVGRAYNCLFEACSTLDCLRTIAAAYNCAVFNNADDFEAVTDVDYCAADDGGGTNGVDWDAEATDWAANFTDYANGNFTPLNDDLPGAGIGPGSDGNVPTTDIIGNSRSGTDCTIGPFEYQAVGPITKAVTGGMIMAATLNKKLKAKRAVTGVI